MFVGVAILADVFMASIETITSASTVIYKDVPESMHVDMNSSPNSTTNTTTTETATATTTTVSTVSTEPSPPSPSTRSVTTTHRRAFRVQVWNPTVANLTLMALGSSAPEILLSAIELVFGQFEAGALGPGTIVGSAAFNLLVILALCIYVIPANDTRSVAQYQVFILTTTCSILAYVWIVVVLLGTSPGVVDLAEALITLAFFPLMVGAAFLIDRSSTSKAKSKQSQAVSPTLLDVKHPDGSPLTQEELGSLVLKLRQTVLRHLSEEEAANVIAQQILRHQPKSRAYWRGRGKFSSALSALSVVGTGVSGRLRFSGKFDASILQRGVKRLVVKSSARLPISREASLEEGGGDSHIGSPPSSPSRRRRDPAAVPEKPRVGFAASTYAVAENGGAIEVLVKRTGPLSETVTVSWETVNGTAVAGKHFRKASGLLTFPRGVDRLTIRVEVIDNDVAEKDHYFTITLKLPKDAGSLSLGEHPVASITILEDDCAGVFRLEQEIIECREGDKEVTLVVQRHGGASNAVDLSYTTVDDSAVAGRHFEAVSGTLSWEHGDTSPRTIKVRLLDILPGSKCTAVSFDVRLFDATNEAIFDSRTDGDSVCSYARVSIVPDESSRSVLSRLVRTFSPGLGNSGVSVGEPEDAGCTATWKAQFSEALECEYSRENAVGVVTHLITLPWKLLGALLPPPTLVGGYPCFILAIFVIGVVTAIIADLANLFSCEISLKPAVAAITVVALGTSLPDTFASMLAAKGDVNADNAIGNVMGSNAVNVFLGLGVSWTIGASYQIANGKAGLDVPPGDLAFSVILFCAIALVAVAILVWRRFSLGAELGGKHRMVSAALFICLWLIYVVLSSLRSYNYIPALSR